MRKYIWILIFLLPTKFANAQEKTFLMANLEFITGYWIHHDSLTYFEEVWSENQSDEMMGSFRMIKNGESIFYEFMTIEKKDSEIRLFLRHYSPGLKSWEEKDSPLIFFAESLAKDKVVFKQQDKDTWLIYELTENKRLTVTLRKLDHGEAKFSIFEYSKK